MNEIEKTKPGYFYVVGLNHKKADTTIRGKFSLNENAKKALLKDGKNNGIPALIVLSTCNRSEIYGVAAHPYQLISLLCKHSKGMEDDFQKVGYIYKEKEAIKHVFRVGSGMDSQILGDFEIIGQLKEAFSLSKNTALITTYFERLFNAVIHASKRIKNETKLSSGATSVAFAAVQYIRHHSDERSPKNILLFGIGKLGRNTCENLVKHTSNTQLTLINRTKEKTNALSGKFNLIVQDYQSLESEIKNTDILIVATGAQAPTIDQSNLKLHKPLLILDLSIPRNVDKKVSTLPGVELLHLDELSQMTNETLKKREQDIPLAEEILIKEREDFASWVHTRRYVPTLKALKAKLEKIKDGELDYHRKKTAHFDQGQADLISGRIIQKITTHFAKHFKQENVNLEESKEWIKNIFQLETEDYG